MSHRSRPHRRILAALLGAALVTAPLVVTADAGAARAKEKCAGAVPDVLGTDRDDVLNGTPGDDVIAGLGGDDLINGRGGHDILCGGPGDDRIVSSPKGTAALWGGPGNDTLQLRGDTDGGAGEAGNDVLVTIARGTRLDGGRGNDTLRGGRHPDDLDGGPGDDRISGGGGRDRIQAGAGDDVVDAGPGDDRTVRGGPGDDQMRGGGGTDLLHGDAGTDTMWTGPGGAAGDDYLRGDADPDVLVVQSEGGNAVGGEGDDVLKADAAKGGLFGEAGDDHLIGSPWATWADGGPGDDSIELGDGDDVKVHGGPGNDAISGGGGDDVLHGDDGIDSCLGGPGTDTCHGGSPGGPENTPTDPDLCGSDVEERISCRQAGMPARWLLTLHGTTTHDPNASNHTETTWSVTTYLDAYWSESGRHWYLSAPTGTSGSWSATGYDTDYGCEVTGSGTFEDGDVSAGLRLDEAEETYALEWGGFGDTPGTWTCDTFTTTAQIHSEAGGAVTGRPWSPIDPEATLSGSDSTDDVTYSWSLKPVQ